MKLAYLILGIGSLAALAGCKSDTMQRDALYSELRMWEDEVACLEDDLDDAESRLESSRRENAALRKQLAQRGGSGGADRDLPEGPSPPTIEIPGGAPIVPPGELPPLEPANPGGEAPPYVPPTDGSQPHFPASRVRRTPPQVNIMPRRQEAEIHDWVVSEITLNRQLTGGHNRDGRPGDEGLMVVVEPRNAAGQIIEVPGEISVVVLDPSIAGPDGRIARWDYSSGESADHFRQSIVGKGIHVELPWPAEPPLGRALELYVRYTTDDGRKLLAERQIQVEPLPVEKHVYAPPGPVHRGAEVRGRIARQALGQDQNWAASPAEGPILASPDSELQIVEGEGEERTARVERLPIAQHEEAPEVEPTSRAVEERGDADHESADEKPAAAPRRKRPEWSPDR